MDWIATLLSVTTSLFAGMALFYLQRIQKRRDEREQKRLEEDKVDRERRQQILDAREERRQREQILLYRVQTTNGDLTYEIANALEHNNINGNVKTAMDKYNKAKDEYYEYLATGGLREYLPKE